MKNKWKITAIIFIVTTIFFGVSWRVCVSYNAECLAYVTEYNLLVDDYEICVNATYEWEKIYEDLYYEYEGYVKDYDDCVEGYRRMSRLVDDWKNLYEEYCE